MIPSLEGWQAKAKEGPSPHEVGQTPLDTNPVFQCLAGCLAASPTKLQHAQGIQVIFSAKHIMKLLRK